MSCFITHIPYLLLTMSLSISVQAEQLTAAIAANFAATIKQLKPLFEHESGHRLITSFASSGTLFAQIHNGAPFDVFLSADEQRPQQLIRDGLGVANPKTAPYGRAAMETLETMELVELTKPYRVTGQNIAQTFQFVASGNAQLGFIAEAQVLALAKGERGAYWRVPKEMHSPIQQMSVMLNRGQKNSVAEAFIIFLQSPQAQSIIRARGYR
jgi:molybdate transport system substrate-binding protein